MKRNELDDLEGKQLEKSWKKPALGAGIDNYKPNGANEANGMNDNASIMAVVGKLTPEQQERAKMLWDELTDLRVKPGLKNRLMGMGHMGALNDPIWKYIYKLRTGGMRTVRDKGGWLVKCLLNDRVRTP